MAQLKNERIIPVFQKENVQPKRAKGVRMDENSEGAPPVSFVPSQNQC